MQSRVTLIIYFRPSPTHSRLYEAVGVSGLHLKPTRVLCKHARAGAKRSELSMTPSELTPDAVGTRSGGTKYARVFPFPIPFP
jgi:hypothetical protein